MKIVKIDVDIIYHKYYIKNIYKNCVSKCPDNCIVCVFSNTCIFFHRLRLMILKDENS